MLPSSPLVSALALALASPALAYASPTDADAGEVAEAGATIPADTSFADPSFLGASASETASSDAYVAEAGSEDAIIVTGRVEGYRTISTTTGTKTNTPILEVPQSISVVTDAQISDQQIRSMADLVRLIPGVSAGQGEGHRDQITLRGNNSTADFFVDGLRDDVQYYRGFYNIERVEAHKGPNAMIFGRGGGGGLINRITKGALLDSNQFSLTASGDSFGAWYGAVDGNIALGPNAALRLNGFYESLNNHRDAFDGKRYAINPVVGAEIGNAKIQMGYEYVRDSRGVDRGIPSAFAGSLITPAGPARGFRDAFFGVRGINETDFTAHVGRLRLEVPLSDSLTFSAQGQYGDYDKVYGNIYAATPVSATSPQTLQVEAYRDPLTRKSWIAQTNLEWRGSTGPIDHVVLIGAEYTDQDTQNARINGFFALPATTANRRATIVLGQKPVIPTPVFVAGTAGAANRQLASQLKQFSVYVQDQIGLSNAIDVVAGLRYDRFDLTAQNILVPANFARTDDLWSPRLGLVVKPSDTSAVYLSYSKSFLPQSGDQFINLDLTSAALKPEKFDNYEIGAKWDLRAGLTLAAAVYRLDRANTRATGPTPGTTLLTGSQRTSGLELSLTGKITDAWNIAAGYGYTRGRITTTTSAAPSGRTLAQLPKHQISLWNRYNFNDDFGVGLGLYHQSASFATISNLTRLPAYTRVDAAIYYSVSPQIDVQLNIENLTNTVYFPVAHNDNNISTGAPLNARITLIGKF